MVMMQSQTRLVGFAYNKQVQNSPIIQQQNGRSLFGATEAIFEKTQEGTGLGDTIRDVINRGVNAIKNSDETARPRFKGEVHAILKLPNGKNGIANFMGPGTAVIKRLKRGDPGRTAADTVAKRHDIDFALAQGSSSRKEQAKAIRAADNRMVSSLQRIKKSGKDATRNVETGLRAIQIKRIAEDRGVFPKPSFSGPLRSIPAGDKAILESNRSKLSQEGFGDMCLPGEELRKKLLRKAKRAKTTRTLTKGGRMDGGFIIALSALIAGLTSAAIAAAQAVALGAAGAVGALVVNKIAGKGIGNEVQSALKKVIGKIKIGLSDLSAMGRVELKKQFEKLKKNPTKAGVETAGKNLATHFKKAVAVKLKKELGLSGGGVKIDSKAFEKKFVSVLKKNIPV